VLIGFYDPQMWCGNVLSQSVCLSLKCLGQICRDSTGTGTGTVPGWNIVTSVRSPNIFCSGAGPCEAFFLDI